jgi:hypothetical protein
MIPFLSIIPLPGLLPSFFQFPPEPDRIRQGGKGGIYRAFLRRPSLPLRPRIVESTKNYRQSRKGKNGSRVPEREKHYPDKDGSENESPPGLKTEAIPFS